MTKADERRKAAAHVCLLRAASDLLHAENQVETTFGSQNSYTCFFAQQAAEKAMKSVLILCGVDFPKTHELADLRRRIPDEKDWAALPRDGAALDALSLWAVTARYGDGWDALTYATEQDAQAALRLAQDVVRGVQQGMAAKGHPLAPERLPKKLQTTKPQTSGDGSPSGP